jgi:Icc-related predicted phosphoesterase
LAVLAILAMFFGALGDVHGDVESVRRIMRRHHDVPFWICVGDVADDEGRYDAFDAPLHWIKGNNENFDAIASRDLPHNLHYLANGVRVQLSGLTVAGLGGTFAPTVYDLQADALPHPRKQTARATILADKRRHFVREEVEACKALRGVDVFLTHEAPRPYIVGGGSGRRGNDAGKTPVNEVLASMHPRLHLFGHHHRFTEANRQGVPSIGLDLVSRSYLLVDFRTLEYERRTS